MLYDVFFYRWTGQTSDIGVSSANVTLLREHITPTVPITTVGRNHSTRPEVFTRPQQKVTTLFTGTEIVRRSTYRATSTGDKNFSYNNLYYEDDWNFSESDRIHNHHHNGFMYLTAYKFVFFIFLKEVRISNTET